jgi:pyruvate formate lyase activating enzyme
VYVGNVHDREGDATLCPGCGDELIARDWYELLAYRVSDVGACPRCGRALEGVFAARPGTFGRRRLPVHIGGEAPAHRLRST